jgi:PilZ domain
MPAASSSSATVPARTQYRHEPSMLIYVTLDDGNGGIIRNLSHDGAALQVVGRLRPEQRVRLRFQLKAPRTNVDAHGEVSWTTVSGSCGIRFLDLPTPIRRQIDEWIFSDLLNFLSVVTATPGSIFEVSSASGDPNQSDGLILSATQRPAIHLATAVESFGVMHRHEKEAAVETSPSQLRWLTRVLSGRALAWSVDGLAITAGLLLFAVVFLSIAHEVPRWQITLILVLLTVPFFAGAYWSLFALFGATSLGARVAKAASPIGEHNESEDRFR